MHDKRMIDFVRSAPCASRAFCQTCRRSIGFRLGVRAPEVCPFGVVSAGPFPSPVAASRPMEVGGPALWLELHEFTPTDAASVSAFLQDFRLKIQCGLCLRHWDELIALAEPAPVVGFYRWSVDRHNDVNRLIGKPIWLIPISENDQKEEGNAQDDAEHEGGQPEPWRQ